MKELLKCLGIAKSSYYYEISLYNLKDKDLLIKEKIIKIFTDNKKRYGYRRITKELNKKEIIINHKKVKRIIKEL